MIAIDKTKILRQIKATMALPSLDHVWRRQKKPVKIHVAVNVVVAQTRQKRYLRKEFLICDDYVVKTTFW